MEPFTMISGAMALADATGLTSWLGSKIGGDVGEKTAKAISGIAQGVTGASSPQEALEKIKADATMASQVRQKIMDQEHELKKLYLDDVSNARAMYTQADHTMADKIADNIMKYNVPFVILLVAILVGVNFIPSVTAGVVSMISALVGGIIGKMLDERSQVTGFFLGSSRSSKDKTDQINRLVR